MIAFIAYIIVINPNIYKKVKVGDYAIILTSLGVFLQYNSIFLLYTICNICSTYNKYFVYIVINEAYFILGQKMNSKEYIKLEILRYYFPKVLMIVLLTTIILNILGYIEKLLHLWISTHLYKQLLKYVKIIQIVTLIHKSGFCELDFLIFKTDLIPKMIVFLNRIDIIVEITNYFHLLLSPKGKN